MNDPNERSTMKFLRPTLAAAREIGAYSRLGEIRVFIKNFSCTFKVSLLFEITKGYDARGTA